MASLFAHLIPTLAGSFVAAILQAQPFITPPPAPYNAKLYTTSAGFIGGIAFDSSGNPLVTPCVSSGGSLRRFDSASTVPSGQGAQTIHPALTTLPSNVGCGITGHPDGTLYSNTDLGVVNVSPVDGHVIRIIGSPGNALGITVDPNCSNGQTSCAPGFHRVVYVAANCRLTSVCDIRTVDPLNPSDDAVFASLTPSQANFVDGIAFGISGTFLVLAVRSPSFGVGVVSVNSLALGARGAWNRLIHLPSEPDGIAFTPNPTPIPSPSDWAGFAITNNTDGTLSRVQLATSSTPDIVTTPPLAAGGFRGDLSQVGPDGILYVSQDGTRFDNGIVTGNDSLVQIGTPGLFSVQVANAQLTLTPLTGANVVGSSHSVAAAIVGGIGASSTAVGQAQAGITVFFTVVSGPNAGLTGSAVTDVNGIAHFSYLGSTGGTDYIQASFTSTSGGVRISNTVVQPWSALLCDVNGDGAINSDDISAIVLARNLSVAAGDARDADHNGIINVTDARLCSLQCSKPNCAK